MIHGRTQKAAGQLRMDCRTREAKLDAFQFSI